MNFNDLSNAIRRSNDWIQSGVEAWLTDVMSGPSPMIFRKLKAICEIGYLEYFVNPNPDRKIRDIIGRSVRSLVREQSFLSLIGHGQEHANLFVPILAICLANGETDKAIDTDIRNLIKYNMCSSKERIPFRIIDLLHLSYVITGIESYYEEACIIAKYGCLGGNRKINSISTTDEYAITHTIFYLTDFGRKPWREELMKRETIVSVVKTLAYNAIDNKDIDLYGEYVMCLIYLGCNAGIFEEHIERVLEKQDTCGYWRGPTELGSALEKEGFDGESLPFYENYHTTIVIKEALSSCLSKRNRKDGQRVEKVIENLKHDNREYYVNINGMLNRLLPEYVCVLNSLRQYCITRKMQINEDIYTNPATIMVGMEMLDLYMSRADHSTAAFMDVFSELASYDLSRAKTDHRMLRMLCLLDKFYNNRGDDEWNNVVNMILIDDVDSEDCMALALLLNRKLQLHDIFLLSNVTSMRCARYIIKRDPNAICTILLYGDRNSIGQHYDDALDLFLSMNSASSSFGWLKETNNEYASNVDVRALITAIKLEMEGEVNIAYID